MGGGENKGKMIILNIGPRYSESRFCPADEVMNLVPNETAAVHVTFIIKEQNLIYSEKL